MVDKQVAFLKLWGRGVVANSFRLHGLQPTRLLCPPLSPGVCSNSYPLSGWCYLTILSCRPFLLLPSISPSIRIFSNESALPIRWPQYWSFSFSICIHFPAWENSRMQRLCSTVSPSGLEGQDPEPRQIPVNVHTAGFRSLSFQRAAFSLDWRTGWNRINS